MNIVDSPTHAQGEPCCIGSSSEHWKRPMGRSMMDDVSSELRRYCREGTANRGVCCGASVANLATDCKLETANGITMVVHLMCAGYSTGTSYCAHCAAGHEVLHTFVRVSAHVAHPRRRLSSASRRARLAQSRGRCTAYPRGQPAFYFAVSRHPLFVS